MEPGESTIEFKRPEDLGVSETEADRQMFKVGGQKKKKGEICPVCGSQMSFKERVNSWYCPNCRSFF